MRDIAATVPEPPHSLRQVVGDEQPSKDDLLTALEAVVRRREALDATVEELVREARRGGASWEEIARTFGQRRQSVWARFRHLDDDPQRP
jgi:hypothetical protein